METVQEKHSVRSVIKCQRVLKLCAPCLTPIACMLNFHMSTVHASDLCYPTIRCIREAEICCQIGTLKLKRGCPSHPSIGSLQHFSRLSGSIGTHPTDISVKELQVHGNAIREPSE